MKERINHLFKKKTVEEKDLKGCMVIYENNKVKEEINRWVNYLDWDSFEDILCKVGFKKDDVINIYETSKRYEYGYSVNNEDRKSKNIIKLSYGSMVDFGPEIIVESDRGFRRYDCIPCSWDKDSEGIELNSFDYKIDDNRSYRGSNFIYTYLIEFKSLEYKILIDIKKNIEDEEKISLKNELEFEKYLTGLTFPISIIDLYNNMCSICELDVDRYSEVFVKVTKSNENNQDKITDMISLKNGVVNEFCITKNDKRIYFSSNGNWSYEMLDNELVNFSMELKDSKINCEFSSNNESELNDYTDTLIKYDIGVARMEVEDTKKLVRSMFPKR